MYYYTYILAPNRYHTYLFSNTYQISYLKLGLLGSWENYLETKKWRFLSICKRILIAFSNILTFFNVVENLCTLKKTPVDFIQKYCQQCRVIFTEKSCQTGTECMKQTFSMLQDNPIIMKQNFSLF